jgi:hypothetical protein
MVAYGQYSFLPAVTTPHILPCLFARIAIERGSVHLWESGSLYPYHLFALLYLQAVGLLLFWICLSAKEILSPCTEGPGLCLSWNDRLDVGASETRLCRDEKAAGVQQSGISGV